MSNLNHHQDTGSRMSPMIYLYFIIFLLSGFSGLIYESVWSRYLKLLLGSAAYAQALVIIIFMGGMAVGAALAAKYTHRLKNIILWYGVCEIVIGLFGLGFHGLFTTTSDLFFNQVASSVDSQGTLLTIKFALASLMILPQSILLGATFPLITAGLIRKYPEKSGNKIAVLYFLNSLGAAIGVLFSAFVLVPSVGLPGTAMTSGIINVVLGLLVYLLTKGDNFSVEFKPLPTKEGNVKLFLIISLITGLASFIYEISWIRMLSMVFGSSTDAFEIMLATFILGLALGALLIKSKIDKLQNPIYTLGIIQVVMGVLAVLTIPLYNELFDYMVVIKKTLTHTDSGYVFYNASNLALSMLVMLPATICAGTTLPLITHILIKKHRAESAVGMVYSFNTVGAIIGVLVTVQLLMPSFGVKSALLVGAALDVVVGAVLVFRFSRRQTMSIIPIAASLAILVGVGLTSSIDLLKVSSGVFRTGRLHIEDYTEILFHEDGKVSTVSVFDNKSKDGKFVTRVISNNGKPDAGVSMLGGRITGDEPTMYLAGILPLLFSTDDVRVANIGFGSGITTESVLSHSQVSQLDTIEIEQKIIDAGKLFAPKVGKVFTDPRSNIIIDDAKTVFSSKGQKYDVIISEPSNPWVSGVASLFTTEWYSHSRKYLTEEGVFVQWIQGYEISMPLFASVYRALRENFDYLTLVTLSGGSDLAVIASTKPLSTTTMKSPFEQQATKEILKSLKIYNMDDLWANRFVADQTVLDYLFVGVGGNSVNSDFFPILDNGAARARFKNNNLSSMDKVRVSRLLKQVFYNKYFVDAKNLKLSAEKNDLSSQRDIAETKNIVAHVVQLHNAQNIPQDDASENAIVFYEKLSSCTNSNYPDRHKQKSTDSILSFLVQLLNITGTDDLLTLLDMVEQQCGSIMQTEQLNRVKALRLFLEQDYKNLLMALQDFSVKDEKKPTLNEIFMLKLLMAAMIKEKNYDQVNKVLSLESTLNSLNHLEAKVLFSYLKQQTESR